LNIPSCRQAMQPIDASLSQKAFSDFVGLLMLRP